MSKVQTINRNRARWYQRFLDHREEAEKALAEQRWREAGIAFKRAGSALVNMHAWTEPRQGKEIWES